MPSELTRYSSSGIYSKSKLTCSISSNRILDFQELFYIGSWVKSRPIQVHWDLNRIIVRSSNVSNMIVSMDFYRWSVEVKSNDRLGEAIGFNEDKLTELFRKTFESKYLDNFQKTLAWQYYRSACPRSGPDRKKLSYMPSWSVWS